MDRQLNNKYKATIISMVMVVNYALIFIKRMCQVSQPFNGGIIQPITVNFDSDFLNF